MLTRYGQIEAMILCLFLSATCLAPAQGIADDACSVGFENEKIVLRGIAEPIDGDTLWLGIHKIRLFGIEALEAEQPCTKDGVKQPCFEIALEGLRRLTENQTIRCEVDRGNFGKPVMNRNRYLATCFNGEIDIGKTMVQNGWALAESDLYLKMQSEAAMARKGMHATDFEHPADYRKSRNQADKCAELKSQCTTQDAKRQNHGDHME